MSEYAKTTTVHPERSRAEIERTLERYGAGHFGYTVSPEVAIVGFQYREHVVRFRIELPLEEEFAKTPAGHKRTAIQRRGARDQAIRQRWRALALAVKAKLEVVESGLVTFEQEFLPYLVVPGGTTVYESAVAAYRTAIADGHPRPMLVLED